MNNTHGTTRVIGRAGLVALLSASSMGAQDRWEDRDYETRDGRRAIEMRDRRRDDDERRLFTWRGIVDDDTRIYVRAGRIESDVVSGAEVRRRERIDRNLSLPRREGTVRVQMLEGRGRVHVIQQPSARNNYTAILRVKDAQSGAAAYRFATYFDPTDDWRVGGSGGPVWRDGGGSVWSDTGSDVNVGGRILRWSGSVDGDMRIVLRRGSMGYQVVSGGQPQNVSSSGVSAMPRRDGQLGVALRQGRGSIVVVQQPASYNDYTTIIRVVDEPRGYGYYDFDLVWR